MKKLYEKPEVEVLQFEITESITDGYVPGVGGSEEVEDWE